MATKEQREQIAKALADFMDASGLKGPYRVDYGQQGVRIELVNGELPFSADRYTPDKFLAALAFATDVAKKIKDVA